MKIDHLVLYGWGGTRVCEELACLLAVPDEQRELFIEHLSTAHVHLSSVDGDGMVTAGTKKGNKLFEEFYRGMRAALNAVEKMSAADAELLCDTMSFSGVAVDAVETCTNMAAKLVGRNIHYPGAHDWRVREVIRDIRTWPERFGASVPNHHRSQKKIIALLHKLMPWVIPANLSPETIKAIWKPRPRKRGCKLK
jgi:hypothetical protein